jgi:HAD superfamily phosphoserine phosphatase-like hydrolase
VSSTIVVTDLDGTLTTAETWRGVLAWVRENHPSRAARWFVRARIPAIVVAKAGLVPKEQFRARWFDDLAGLLAGLPADREEDLAASVVDTWLWPARRDAALERVAAALAEARATDPGARLVVATGAFESIAAAWARRMGADVALGTPLEIADGRLTGRLGAAVQTGEQKASAVRALADGGVIAAAFGDTGADAAFLRLAQRAVAVAPDSELRRVADGEGWEILDPA